jgi:transposase
MEDLQAVKDRIGQLQAGPPAVPVQQLGIGSESLRGWVRQAEVDGGRWPGMTTAEQQRIAELEREVRELRRANDILKGAPAFTTPTSTPSAPNATTSASWRPWATRSPWNPPPDPAPSTWLDPAPPRCAGCCRLPTHPRFSDQRPISMTAADVSEVVAYVPVTVARTPGGDESFSDGQAFRRPDGRTSSSSLAGARSGRVIARLPRIDVRDSLTLCN